MHSETTFHILTDSLSDQRQHLKSAVEHMIHQDTDMFIISKDRQYLPCHKALLSLFSPLAARLLQEVACCVAPTIFLPDFPAHLIRKFLHILQSGQTVTGKNSNVDIKFLKKIGDVLSVNMENLQTGKYINNPLGDVKVKQERGVKQEMMQASKEKINIKQELFFNSENDYNEEESEYVEEEDDTRDDNDTVQNESEESPVGDELPGSDSPGVSEAIDIPIDLEASDVPSDLELSDVPSDLELSDVPSDLELSDVPSDLESSDVPSDLELSDVPSDLEFSDVPSDLEVSDIYSDSNEDDVTKNIEGVLAMISQDNLEESEIVDNDFNQPTNSSSTVKISSEKVVSPNTNLSKYKSTENEVLLPSSPSHDQSEQTNSSTVTHHKLSLNPKTPTRNKDRQINSLIADTPREERLNESIPHTPLKGRQINSAIPDTSEEEILNESIPDTPPKRRQINSLISETSKEDSLNKLIPDTPPKGRQIISLIPDTPKEDRLNKLIPDTPPREKQTHSDNQKLRYVMELNPLDAFEKTVNHGGMKFTDNGEYMEIYPFVIEVDKIKLEEDRIKNEEDKKKRKETLSNLQKMLAGGCIDVENEEHKIESSSQNKTTNKDKTVDEKSTKSNSSFIELPRDEIDDLLDGNDDMDNFETDIEEDFGKKDDTKVANVKNDVNNDNETSIGKRKRNNSMGKVYKKPKLNEPELLPQSNNKVKTGEKSEVNVNKSKKENSDKKATSEGEDVDEEKGNLILTKDPGNLVLTRDPAHQVILREIFESFSRKEKKGAKIVWICTECDREFSSKRLVHSHIDFRHTDHVLHKCIECGLIKTTLDSLMRHGKVHNRKK